MSKSFLHKLKRISFESFRIICDVKSIKSLRSALLLSLLLVPTAGAAVLRVASISPLSGSRAVTGAEVKRGAELAVETRVGEFRKRGHVLSFFALDDLSNPTRAAFIAKNIQADPRILGVVGPQSSGVTNALAAALKDTPVAIVNPTSTNDALTSHDWNFFNRLVAPDSAQAVAASEYISGTLKASVVYVVSDETTYGNGLSTVMIKELKRQGVRVGGYMGASKAEQFKSVISEVKRAGADAVYFGGTDVQGAALLKALRAAGVSAPLIGGDGLYSTGFTDAAGADATGVVFTSTFAPPTLLPSAADFVKRYKAKYGAEPNGRALYAYDAMNVLLDSILVNLKPGAPAPTRAQVIKSVREYTSKSCASAACEIITGPASFNSTGERQVATVYLMRVGAAGIELLGQQKVQAGK